MKTGKFLSAATGAAAVALLFLATPTQSVNAAVPENGWYEENGNKYWYVNGVRQGTEGRGTEIYDPASDAWYWLDAAENGKMAANKEVFLEAGSKWVRYDENGHMVKGWYTNENGTYCYDMTTGAMLKGILTIDGIPCVLDSETGIGLDCQWYSEQDGTKYWYEGGRRQGIEGRGKEIYDPSSNAWYWLDAVDGGKMAVSKDVYQESDGGKWVRYDENGHMIKGEHVQNDEKYRFDLITGAMIKGWYTTTNADGKEITYYYDEANGKMTFGSVMIDGKYCLFDSQTGIGLDDTWYTENGNKYWYENGVRQGTEGRGKEIFDPASNAWYWLDAVDHGKMATSKDVYQESNGGKWVRYDENGHMLKDWNTKDGKRYYFDPITGAMATGIVRINGTDYSFDEQTGEYKGLYEGGEISYSWVNTKENRTYSNGSLAGYTNYDYNDEGLMERARVYNQDRRIMTEDKYTYDESGNTVSHSFRNYADSNSNYTETFVYEDNLLTEEKLTDSDGSVSEIRKHTYTGTKLTRTDIFNAGNILQSYITYAVDAKGNVTKASHYNIYGTLLGYTTYTYSTFSGQSFLRLCLEYDADNSIIYGEEYTRNGYDLEEEIIYTNNRVVSSRTVYELSSFPDGENETSCEKASNTYDKDDNLMYHTVYEYELMEVTQ